MAKWTVHLVAHFFGTAEVEVEAESEVEALEEGRRIPYGAQEGDPQDVDWDMQFGSPVAGSVRPIGIERC